MRRHSFTSICSVLLIICLLQQVAAHGAPSAPSTSAALLTEAHGDVYKRTFIDWTKETLGDPQRASVGDSLHEGMQVGTGDNSWAQIKWRNLCARAWANSVYAIAPNQRLVYLVGGEMLYQLDKKRKDKSAYYLWTNLLQARVRGTTVLVQATKTKSRITVIEGTIEVFNKVDRSLVTLTPGVVYEISLKPDAAGAVPSDNGKTDNASSTGDTNTTNAQPRINPADSLRNISSSAIAPVPVFDTSKTVSRISPVDTTAILSHPLLNSFTEPLSSLPLITTAMAGADALLKKTGTVLDSTVSILHDNLRILHGPRALAYNINSGIHNIATIAPGAISYFAPDGTVDNSGAVRVINSVAALTGTGGHGALPAGAVVPGVQGLTNNLGGAATGAISGLSGTTMNTAVNALSASGTTVGGVGAAVTGGAGAVLGGVGGTLTGVGGSVGGAVGGVVNGVGGVVNGAGTGLGGVVNGLGNTVGGLGGLLGH